MTIAPLLLAIATSVVLLAEVGLEQRPRPPHEISSRRRDRAVRIVFEEDLLSNVGQKYV